MNLRSSPRPLPVWQLGTLAVVGLTGCSAGEAGGPPALEREEGLSQTRPVVRFATRSDASPPLRATPERPAPPPVLATIFEKPRHPLPNRFEAEGAADDEALQAAIEEAAAPGVLGSFAGLANSDNAAVLGSRMLPPDVNGDIGPDHYVQWVNGVLAVYDRTGSRVLGPIAGSRLWQGFGGPCEASNDGDPIALYDHLADRWLMSQFALPNFPSGPFYQCIAVSQTPDPTGAYHRYEFLIDERKMNDYPKLGVGPDAYALAINQYRCELLGCRWAGQGAVAFERDAMLDGLPARMIRFDLERVDPNLGGMLPADLDGPAQAPGVPVPFCQVDDDAWGYSPDQVQCWELAADWVTPGSSTFTFAVALRTAAFNSNMCGYSRNCIPQPGGTPVDALSDRLMARLQLREFGSHRALLVSHTTDVGGDHAGIRWYELRDSGRGWSIEQQGTYAPDGDNRWMGSVAMNGIGDVMLGFSVSSAVTYPSVRVTGRLAEDPAGTMTQGEATLAAGRFYQSHSSGRWGDYSMMAVDPVDDCTFVYTQEYYDSNDPATSAEWVTRWGFVKERDCAGCVSDSDCAQGGGLCCGGSCTAAACVADAACDDANACTIDTCSNAGTCTASCSSTWAACGAIDGCCGPACDGSSDPDCPAAVCGDGACAGAASGEDCRTCSSDCRCSGRSCRNACCGDGVCSNSENDRNCPIDC
ncbi:MAG: hypothetical protein HYY06_17695 [Deltaproteobacteria bacterium]|nr:hypothetical protein [Deltaproteobacteria bacterium]